MYRVRPSIIVLVVLIVLATAFILRLINLRFQDPNMHPPYSSMRFDPLGTSGFYDSLERIPSIEVSRNFKPAGRFDPQPASTYYYYNLAPGYELVFNQSLTGFANDSPLNGAMLEHLLAIPEAGSRVVLTFAPQAREAGFIDQTFTIPPPTPPPGDDDDDDDGAASTTQDTSAAETPPTATTGTETIMHEGGTDTAFTTLGFTISFNSGLPSISANPGPDAPEYLADIAWHTNLHFTDLDPAWRVIYTAKDQPVIIERDHGDGTIVLVADSYPFSNEALRIHREQESARTVANGNMLQWTLGDHHRVIIDEAHLGVISHTGLAGLARRFRLHGLASGLLLLAILFIWKNATSLVPAQSPFDESGQLIRTDYDVNSGYVNLLRRHIPSEHVVRTCYDQWRESLPPARDDHRRHIAKIDDIFASESGETVVDRRPVATYNAIRRILAERKRRP